MAFSVYTCFTCRTDGHLSRFCSQMESSVDHSSNNNTLYPHGPQLLVNLGCEQNVLALTPGHHDDKRDKPYTQSSAKSNRTDKRFGTYPEVTSNEDIFSEEFTHKIPSRSPMKAGWVLV